MKKNLMNIMKFVNKIIVFNLVIITLFLLIIGFITRCNKEFSTTPSPVKGCDLIDSLNQNNNTLTIEINNLDSIKNVEIVKVKNLDNDSTLVLFYKLLGK